MYTRYNLWKPYPIINGMADDILKMSGHIQTLPFAIAVPPSNLMRVAHERRCCILFAYMTKTPIATWKLFMSFPKKKLLLSMFYCLFTYYFGKILQRFQVCLQLFGHILDVLERVGGNLISVIVLGTNILDGVHHKRKTSTDDAEE